MKPPRESSTRREFLHNSAMLVASSSRVRRVFAQQVSTPGGASFTAYQQQRRKELWSLLGDLPWQHRPDEPKLLKREEHGNYVLERWLLDLNGMEPVPALLLIPYKRQNPAPGMLYIHWHAGMYGLGKEQLISGVKAQPAYAPVCAEKGIVTLAIDSWCFGERKHESDGSEGEQTAFKLMLWKGQVLYGMMMFDEFRALDFLASRPEVDTARLAALGMSMGATKAWWLAALDPRVKVCMDVCCLTEYDELIKTHGLKEHGIYYYVPSLLKHFQPAGVEKIREHLLPLYREHGRESDCRIDLFDCEHVELPEMRKLILEWMDRLVAPA